MKFVFTDYIGLSTNPRIGKGDIVELVDWHDEHAFVRHKGKIVSFHITNITKDYFREVI